MSESSKTPDKPALRPVSYRIRERISNAKQRFHANDNIAAFLEPGDLEALIDEVEGKMKGVLESLVIDTESDHKQHAKYGAACRQDVPDRSLSRPLHGGAGLDRVPQRRTS